MDEDQKSSVLLIDLENRPNQMEQLLESTERFSRIIVCHGSVEPRAPLGLMMQLAPMVCAGRLEVVRMKKQGKNAADFGLAFHAGRLLSEMPATTEFIILSEDADLDHVVNLLHSMQRKAERLSGRPRPAPVICEEVRSLAAYAYAEVEEYIATHLRQGMPRPAKKATLLHSIQSAFKQCRPQEILAELVAHQVLTITGTGRVRYLDGVRPIVDEDDDVPF